MVRLARFREGLCRLSRYRSIRLTPIGTGYLLLTLGVGAAAINTGHNLLYLFFAMMLSLIIISGVLSEQCFKKLEIRRDLPRHLFANQPIDGGFILTNRKAWLPTFSLRLTDVMETSAPPGHHGAHIFSLAPGATRRQRYSLLFGRRGRYRMEGVRLATRFPFGFFTKAAVVALPADVVVYPEVRPLPELIVRDMAISHTGQSTVHRGPGAGLHNLRLYQPGDDSRTIHWRTTAKKAQLIVRETEAENQNRVTLALYTGLPDLHACADAASMSHEHAFEDAVTLMASLTDYFHRREYEIRLLVGEQDIPAGIGDPHFHRLLTLLALCRPTDTRSPQCTTMLQNMAKDDEYSVVVLPLPDPLVRDRCRGASRILVASESLRPA